MLMKNFRNKFACSIFLLLFTTVSSAATITILGEIEEADNGSPEIDFYSFTVDVSGMVDFTIDAAFFGYDAGNGPSTLDSYIMLAFDDGVRDESDIITTNDDFNGVDSFLSLFLDAGDYLAAISSCCLTPDEFISGTNSSISFGNSLVGTTPDYRLTIEGDVSLDNNDPMPVSAPSVFVLMSIALVAFGFRRAIK